jgi:phosphatidylglycerol:prolipoprotein diacylglycerol transferase
MNFSLHLSDFQSALIWNTAMVAGILIAFTLQWHEGKRRGFDMPSWITVLAVTYVAMLLGERLGAFTISDWQALGRGEGLPAHVGKTAIGGGLLALPVFFLLRKWFRLPAASIDVLLVPLLLAAAVSRIGCFFAGCCFGEISPGGWGVCYTPQTPAFAWQSGEGLLGADASVSLPVLPVQLFVTGFGIAAFLVLWRLRDRFKSAGSLGFLTLGALATNRFFVEFFRETGSNRGILGTVFGGLPLTQWFALFVAALMVYAYWRNESRRPVSRALSAPSGSMPLRAVLLFAALASALACSDLLSLEERLILLLVTAPVVYTLAQALRRDWIGSAASRTSAGLLSAAGIALLIVPLDTLGVGKPANDTVPPADFRPTPEKKANWFEFGLGGVSGSYQREIVSKDCDGNITSREKYKIQTNSVAFDASYNIPLERGKLGFGLRAITGVSQSPDYPADDFTFRGANPYMRWDGRGFGISAGALFASRGIQPGARQEKVLPTLGLRFGKVDYFHIVFDSYQHAGLPVYPEPSYSSTLHFGFRDPTGAKNLGGGIAYTSGENNARAGVLLSFRHPIGRIPLTVNGSFFFNGQPMGGVGLRYIFR